METPKAQEIQAVIAYAKLDEALPLHASKINLPTIYVMATQGQAPGSREIGAKNAHAFIGEIPFPRAAELYAKPDRDKFFPGLENGLAKAARAINTDNIKIALSPTTIYCAKTGQPIGTLSKEVLAQSLDFLGEEKFAYAMYNSPGNNVAPLWLYTGETNRAADLDLLIEKDPKGYAAYCLNLLTGHYVKNYKRNAMQESVAHHWALARAYQWLGLLSPVALSDLNDNLCGALIYGPEAAKHLARELGNKGKMPDDFARMAVEETLNILLENAINSVLASLGRYHTPGQPVQPTVKAAQAKGPSNARKTRKAKERTITDEHMLAVFKHPDILAMPLYSMFQKDGKRPVEAPKARGILHKLQNSDPISRAPINDADISALEETEFNFEDVDFSETDDENTVEIRTIPRQLLADYIPPPEPEKPVSLTLMQKIALQVEAQKQATEAKNAALAIEAAKSQKPAPKINLNSKFAHILAKGKTS